MTRRPFLPLCAAVLALCSPVAASAQVSFHGLAEVGGLAAFPTGYGPSQGGVGSAIELGVRVGKHRKVHLDVAGRLQFFLTSSTLCGSFFGGCDNALGSPAGSLSLEVRGVFDLARHFRLGVGASGGWGFWGGCINGDWCGGGGGLLGVDLHLFFPVDRIDLSLGFEPQVQIGMVNGVDALVMPTLWLGVGW